jgi:ferrous iron transport protein B
MSLTIALIGNPNAGKSTLFNALTGSKQKIGNWPGVTVERKTGCCKHQGQNTCVIDLPGIYHLNPNTDQASIDVKIVVDFILKSHVDLLVNVIDASNLDRNLFLSTQLAELGIPMVVALNMMDIAKKKGITIDVDELSRSLNCPVIPIVAKNKRGLDTLKDRFLDTHLHEPIDMHYPEKINVAISDIATRLPHRHRRFMAGQLLEGNLRFLSKLSETEAYLKHRQRDIEMEFKEDLDIILADHRYRFIDTLLERAVHKTNTARKNITRIIDNIVLNRFLGIPIFLGVMYLMFLFAINIGGAFQDFFDIGSNTIFVQGMAQWLSAIHCPVWLNALISAGIGKGINTTITFIPVIGAMFLFLAFLESTGYMTRAAFVVDRLMRFIGLPGKSFVPMIVGFGCNVPAIMACRTIETPRDRILTILMSPFMSCGARLAIFAVFTAAFFPVGGQNVVFALYIIGILAAIFTGLILKKTILKGDTSPLVMEMPAYHFPSVTFLIKQMWQRLKRFLFKAGKIIIPVCILIGSLNAITTSGHIRIADGSNQNTLLAETGRTITPILAPMGVQSDNWPATVGLMTGMLAKEVVVATLNTLYTQQSHLKAHHEAFSMTAGLLAAVQSVPDNLRALGSSLGNPVLASAPEHKVTQGVYGVMYKQFGGQAAAFAYLLFVLLYFPCASATAAMTKELNRRWTLFSIAWTTGLAYGVAVLFYQAATFQQHPLLSSAWIVGILAVFLSVIFSMRAYAKRGIRFKAIKSGNAHDAI